MYNQGKYPKTWYNWENIRLRLDLIWEMIHLGFYPFGKYSVGKKFRKIFYYRKKCAVKHTIEQNLGQNKRFLGQETPKKAILQR